MPPVPLSHDDGLTRWERADQVGWDPVGLLAPTAGGDPEAGCSGLVKVLPDCGGACELEERLGQRHPVDDRRSDIRHEPFGVVAEAREALRAEHERDAG